MPACLATLPVRQLVVPCHLYQAIDSNRYKLEHRRNCLNITLNFFTVRVVKYWHRFLTEDVKSLSLEILRSHLDMVLSNLLQVALLEHDG